VRRVLKRHGYRPNPMVSALMAQLRSSRRKVYQPTLAFLNAWWPPTVWWQCPTKTAQFHGAEARAAELGYKLEMFWLGARGMTSDRMVGILRTRGVQGVLVGPIQHAWKGLAFGWEHFSVATISFSIVEPRVTNAGAAVFQAMARLMAELLARGYRRVGYITSRDFERRVDTLAGGAFRLFQREFAAPDRLEPLIFDYDVETEGVRSWLRRERPDVIVTRLPNVYEAIVALGYGVPGDLGFAHLDLPPALCTPRSARRRSSWSSTRFTSICAVCRACPPPPRSTANSCRGRACGPACAAPLPTGFAGCSPVPAPMRMATVSTDR
jgi:DNA-binding LacI/PurR family transcriptional regulator